MGISDAAGATRQKKKIILRGSDKTSLGTELTMPSAELAKNLQRPWELRQSRRCTRPAESKESVLSLGAWH